MVPLLEGLERGFPLLGPLSLPPDTRASLRAAADGLPDAWYCLALEARLSSDDPRVDLLVCARADDGGRRELLGGVARLAAAQPASSAWRRIEDFCLAWAREGTLLHEDVPFVWLEFDLPSGPQRAPAAPFVFFCVQRDFLTSPFGYFKLLHGEVRTEARQLRLIDEGLSLLLGQPPWPRVLDRVARCLAALPLAGHLLHVAPLSQRSLEAVRLVLTLPREEVLSYLQEVGWPGRLDEVGSLMGRLHPKSPMVGIQLDVGEVVGGVLGIQVYFSGPDARWTTALDTLVELGLCEPSRRRAALGWPGQETVSFSSRRWPVRLRRELELKLVWRPDQPPVAKAYFGMGADFLLFADAEPALEPST